MPRILHVITGLATGGAEMALYRLIMDSRGSDYTHAVVALTGGGAMRQRFDEAGIELVVFDFKASPISHFIRLISLMRRISPDVVQTWMYHADLLGGMAARIAGIRNVIWGIRTSELSVGNSRATFAVRRICAWLSRWVPRTIVCVAEAACRSHARAGYDSDRMVVVPNGFDLSRLVASPEERARLRMQCGFESDQVVIGTLGRFNARKDQHNFVRAAGLLAQQHKESRFLMVGRDVDVGNMELMQWIKQTGHADRFVLLGERADVPVCLAAMDIFCLSSRIEGFPNVVGEAMAMGVPCVVTDVGDAAALVADAGKVVPRSDPISLARALANMAAMPPEERKQLGRKAQTRIRSEFTIDQSRKRFEEIYKDLTVMAKLQ